MSYFGVMNMGQQYGNEQANWEASGAVQFRTRAQPPLRFSDLLGPRPIAKVRH
jgi:hypothetical protein